MELSRDLGLRVKEASLLDARKAEKQAREQGQVVLNRGTKGGRVRTVPITRRSQLDTLNKAAQTQIQGKARSMIDPSKSWKEWRERDIRQINDTLKAHNINSIRELRASYACDRYEQLTGYSALVVAGQREVDKNTDRDARSVISNELGHTRIDVVASYIGSSA